MTPTTYRHFHLSTRERYSVLEDKRQATTKTTTLEVGKAETMETKSLASCMSELHFSGFPHMNKRINDSSSSLNNCSVDKNNADDGDCSHNLSPNCSENDVNLQCKTFDTEDSTVLDSPNSLLSDKIGQTLDSNDMSDWHTWDHQQRRRSYELCQLDSSLFQDEQDEDENDSELSMPKLIKDDHRDITDDGAEEENEKIELNDSNDESENEDSVNSDNDNDVNRIREHARYTHQRKAASDFFCTPSVKVLRAVSSETELTSHSQMDSNSSKPSKNHRSQSPIIDNTSDEDRPVPITPENRVICKRPKHARKEMMIAISNPFGPDNERQDTGDSANGSDEKISQPQHRQEKEEDSTLKQIISEHEKASQILQEEHFSEALVAFKKVLKLAHSFGLNENHPLVSDSVWHVCSINSTLALINDADEMHRLGMYYDNAGDYKNALKSFHSALDLKVRAFGSSPYASLSKTMHQYGVVHWKIGSYQDALYHFNEALNINQRISQPTQEMELTLAEIFHSIGKVHLSLGHITPALSFFRKSLAKRKEIHNCHDHPDVAQSIISMGKAFEEKGRHTRAMKCYQEGLRIQAKFHSGEHYLPMAATLNCMGVVHEKWREYASAMECYQRALSILHTHLKATQEEDTNHNNHLQVDIAVTLVNVGQIYRFWLDYDNAMSSYKEALSIFSHLLGDHHRNVASTMYHIGLLQVAKDEDNVAMSTFKSVLKIQRAALGDMHMDVAITLDSLAEVFEKHGKYEKALKICLKALKVRRAALGKEHLYVGISLYRLGLFQSNVMDNPKEALNMFVEALRVYRINSLKDDHSRVRVLLKHMEHLHATVQD